ncbi:MAG: DegT/DnrJ/EryC1/StrS family aminotransferase [Phycisphaerales bacterium]|jgi:perosamine synthetase
MTTARPAVPSVGLASTLAVHGGTPVSASPVPFMLPKLAEADIAAATAVLHSGMLRAAKKCEELETRIAQLSGAKHAMTCANGTCALQLAYEPLFQPGDDILVPAWSYIATAAMLVARGCNPIFVDANPQTGQIDMADAARRITPKTRGIAATHMYGCPVDIDAVQSLASAKGLKVVYDAAQAHLSTWHGKGIGQFGDAVTYSFYATKNLATGEGGMTTCNDDALARQIRLLRSHGETNKYLHEQVGYNYRMNDIAGAIGCSRLDRLPAETDARRAAAKRYEQIIASTPAIARSLRALSITPGAVSAYHLFTIKLDLSTLTVSRDEFAKALLAEGVPNAVHYPRSLPQQPAFAKHLGNQKPWPVAEDFALSVLSLPMHHGLTDAHFGVVAEALAKVCTAYAR